MHPLSLKQVNQLLTAVRDERLFAAIFLEMGTGLRKGEILGLGWQDVDLAAEVVTSAKHWPESAIMPPWMASGELFKLPIAVSVFSRPRSVRVRDA